MRFARDVKKDVPGLSVPTMSYESLLRETLGDELSSPHDLQLEQLYLAWIVTVTYIGARHLALPEATELICAGEDLAEQTGGETQSAATSRSGPVSKRGKRFRR